MANCVSNSITGDPEVSGLLASMRDGFQGASSTIATRPSETMRLNFTLEQVKMAQSYQKLYHFMEDFWSCVDSSPFQGNWHIECICDHLEAVTRGQIKRLLINIPPRHGKSLAVSVFWPVWEWIHKPETQFMFASYGLHLSMRDSTKCRRLIEHPRYVQLCKRFAGREVVLTGDQNTKVKYENNFGGYRLATSVGGALTGEGAGKIIIDDPHNVIEAESPNERAKVVSWWKEAMSNRLNDPKTGAFVLIQQRVHSADLIGHLLDSEPRKWVHLCIPARYECENRIKRTPLEWRDPRTEAGQLLWPDRYGEVELADLEESMGAYAAAAQLQQRPAPREGGMVQANWIIPISADAVPAKVEKRVRWWDLAASVNKRQDPDYTAGALVSIRSGIYYIEDIVRLRGTPYQVEQAVLATATRDPEGTLIYMEQEGGAGGLNTIDHYAREVLVGWPFRGMRSTGSKEKFVETLSAAMQAGNVKMVKGTWNAPFVEECTTFPNGRHDDMIDAVSKACSLMRKTKRIGTWGTRNDQTN